MRAFPCMNMLILLLGHKELTHCHYALRRADLPRLPTYLPVRRPCRFLTAFHASFLGSPSRVCLRATYSGVEVSTHHDVAAALTPVSNICFQCAEIFCVLVYWICLWHWWEVTTRQNQLSVVTASRFQHNPRCSFIVL